MEVNTRFRRLAHVVARSTCQWGGVAWRVLTLYVAMSPFDHAIERSFNFRRDEMKRLLLLVGLLFALLGSAMAAVSINTATEE